MTGNKLKEAQPALEFDEIALRGMRFTYRHIGLQQTGETVILLHGFPQTSRMWDDLMPQLAAQGFRCLAPDLRGYSSGARPHDLAAYKLSEIVADVRAFADAHHCDRFHLIGHDWGAAVGWILLGQVAERISSWTAISIPHLQGFIEAIQSNPAQKRKSMYMKLFRRRLLPELVFLAGRHLVMRKMWKRIPREKCDQHIAEVGNYATLKAALNWYRANEIRKIQVPPVTTPTLFIQARFDEAVSEAAVHAAVPYMRGPYEVVCVDAGHWVVEEEPRLVSAAILRHLSQNLQHMGNRNL